MLEIESLFNVTKNYQCPRKFCKHFSDHLLITEKVLSVNTLQGDNFIEKMRKRAFQYCFFNLSKKELQ